MKMQKKLTPHCHQCASEDDCSANCSLLTTLICWEAVKNSNSLQDGREKSAAGYGMEITQTKIGTSITEVKIRLAQAYSAMIRLNITLLSKSKAISFPTKVVLYKYLSCTALWMLELVVDCRSGETNLSLLKNAKGGYLAYHIQNNLPSIWLWIYMKLFSILVGCQEFLLSNVNRS